MPPVTSTEELEARFWAKVDHDIHNKDQCWPWLAATQRGYGVFHFLAEDGVRYGTRAHRQAYALFWGEMDNYTDTRVELDHTCHDPVVCKLGNDCPHRRCCNPFHLSPSNAVENGASDRMVYWQLAKTHCPSGHPYDAANTQYRKNGHRVCGTCNRARALANKSRRAAA